MKKSVLNIIRRICGTTHLHHEIEQLKNIVFQNNYSPEKIAFQINCNLLQLVISSQKKFFQLRPGDNLISLYNTKHGLSFSPNVEDSGLPEIFIVTLPKSGTYFWGKILQECGYQDIRIHAAENCCADYRSLPVEGTWTNQTACHVDIPFYLQMSLLLKGQYLLGHLPYACAPYLQGKNFFITTRDLRTSIVSWLRFGQRKRVFSGTSWFNLGNTEEGVFALLTSSNVNEIIINAEENGKWVSAFPERVLRYEALSDPASKEFAHVVDTLGQLTGLAPDVITAAISRAQGTKTMTYSGSPSSTAGIWSERIEKVFCELKLDLLNEKLGYSREWKK